MQYEIILETQRTYLRQICSDDFTEIADILQDGEVMYAWEHAFSDREVHDWIQENRLRYTRDGYGYWAVIEKQSHRLIGVSGLIAENADNQDYIGIGYIFHKFYWCRGFAFECANSCKSYAFNNLQVSLLTAQIRPDNIASRKVAEKLGMSVIKQFNRLYRGKQIPHLLYGCSNE